MAELREKSMSTVLLGRFNPLIFTPDWLESHKAIGPVEAEDARNGGVELISPAVTSIKFGGMKLLVEEGRFTLIVADEPLIRAKDFPSICFSLLRHSPVHAVGLNCNQILVGNDQESWHRLGDRLAPKDPWGELLIKANGERKGGLRSIMMERSGGEDERWRYTRVNFEVQEGLPLRALINVNNHFTLGKDAKPQSGAEALRVLSDLWEPAMQLAGEISEELLRLADAV